MFASAGHRTRAACVTGWHLILYAYYSQPLQYLSINLPLFFSGRSADSFGGAPARGPALLCRGISQRSPAALPSRDGMRALFLVTGDPRDKGLYGRMISVTSVREPYSEYEPCWPGNRTVDPKNIILSMANF
jgi:hypothetical protein